jgi:hypothetical protein
MGRGSSQHFHPSHKQKHLIQPTVTSFFVSPNVSNLIVIGAVHFVASPYRSHRFTFETGSHQPNPNRKQNGIKYSAMSDIDICFILNLVLFHFCMFFFLLNNQIVFLFIEFSSKLDFYGCVSGHKTLAKILGNGSENGVDRAGKPVNFVHLCVITRFRSSGPSGEKGYENQPDHPLVHTHPFVEFFEYSHAFPNTVWRIKSAKNENSCRQNTTRKAKRNNNESPWIWQIKCLQSFTFLFFFHTY